MGSSNKGLSDIFCRHPLRAMLNKVFEIASFVMIVRFIIIHLNPGVYDGPYPTPFQGILLLACKEVDSGVADVLFKYFVEHGSQCLQKMSL